MVLSEQRLERDLPPTPTPRVGTQLISRSLFGFQGRLRPFKDMTSSKHTCQQDIWCVPKQYSLKKHKNHIKYLALKLENRLSLPAAGLSGVLFVRMLFITHKPGSLCWVALYLASTNTTGGFLCVLFNCSFPIIEGLYLQVSTLQQGTCSLLLETDFLSRC